MTSRRLVLLRHAKAERPDGATDIERPLTERGHADATAAGAWLAGHDLLPDLVICSPSKRTRQTVGSLRLRSKPKIVYDRQLYDGDAADLLTLVRAVDDGVRTVLLVGHNPTVSDLSFRLDPDSGADSDGLRTAGLAVHEVDGSWADLITAKLAGEHTARG